MPRPGVVPKATGSRPCLDFQRQLPSRREWLRVGGMAALAGLSLPQLWQARARAEDTLSPKPGAASVEPGFGRARSCILIFQWGGPSQLDTWDPKPEAPAEIRGSFNPIATSVPGTFISEHFPLLAQQMHRLALVRSMTHDDPAHLSTVHRLQTGHLAPRPNSDADGPSNSDWPHLGAFVARLMPPRGTLPPAVILPWVVSHPAAPGGRAPGQHGGWLGKAFDPFVVVGDPNAPAFQVPGLGLPAGVDADRLTSRRNLLGRISLGHYQPAPPSWDRFQTRAIDTLTSTEAQTAFNIDREDPRLRDRYGRHIHGQGLLLARRLVEAGVPLVTVNWHNDGQNFWDTHGDNFNQLKNRLMPPADAGFSALLDDLDSRGMLDETLVVWVGEFGRNPRITAANAGREHWPRCYTAALAGAGINGGYIHGASDRWAAYPSRDPVSPEDLSATILHSLGIAPTTVLEDPQGRPLQITTGSPVTTLFS